MVHAAYGGGGEVADGLNGVDGEQQPKSHAGGQVEADAEVEKAGQGEPRGVPHVGKAYHAEAQRRGVAEEHAQQDGGQLAHAPALVV